MKRIIVSVFNHHDSQLRLFINSKNDLCTAIKDAIVDYEKIRNISERSIKNIESWLEPITDYEVLLGELYSAEYVVEYTIITVELNLIKEELNKLALDKFGYEDGNVEDDINAYKRAIWKEGFTECQNQINNGKLRIVQSDWKSE